MSDHAVEEDGQEVEEVEATVVPLRPTPAAIAVPSSTTNDASGKGKSGAGGKGRHRRKPSSGLLRRLSSVRERGGGSSSKSGSPPVGANASADQADGSAAVAAAESTSSSGAEGQDWRVSVVVTSSPARRPRPRDKSRSGDGCAGGSGAVSGNINEEGAAQASGPAAAVTPRAPPVEGDVDQSLGDYLYDSFVSWATGDDDGDGDGSAAACRCGHDSRAAVVSPPPPSPTLDASTESTAASTQSTDGSGGHSPTTTVEARPSPPEADARARQTPEPSASGAADATTAAAAAADDDNVDRGDNLHQTLVGSCYPLDVPRELIYSTSYGSNDSPPSPGAPRVSPGTRSSPRRLSSLWSWGGEGGGEEVEVQEGSSDGPTEAAAVAPRRPSYFDPRDFSTQTWSDVLNNWHSDNPAAVPAVGIALTVAAATVVVHPLVFVAGAVTAVWAVGVFHAVERGCKYEFFSDGAFRSIFWLDEDDEAVGSTAALLTDGKSTDGESSGLASTSLEGARSYELIKAQESRIRDAKARAEQMELVPTVTESSGEEDEDDDEDDDEDEKARMTDEAKVRTEAEAAGADGSEAQVPSETAALPLTVSTGKGSPSAQRAEVVPAAAAAAEQQQQPTLEELVGLHFPALETQVVRRVEFPGLNAIEFFDVFFSDAAPYSLREFHERRGDVDISFGRWGRRVARNRAAAAADGNRGGDEPAGVGAAPCSFLLDGADGPPLPGIPNASVRERTLRFKTLTKSYFGAAYASATKTQRVTKLSKRLVVIENKTELSDVPFSDRFHVVDRWVIEAVKHGEEDAGGGSSSLAATKRTASAATAAATEQTAPILYTSKLTVYVQVNMLRSCTWEAQIRKKTQSTITDLVKSWCEKATKALQLTEEKKLERMRMAGELHDEEEEEEEEEKVRSNSPVSRSSSLFEERKDSDVSPRRDGDSGLTEEQLMAVHVRNFKELERRIEKGDLEWCSVEVQHSIDAGSKSAFAKVLPSSHDSGGKHALLKSSSNERNPIDDEPMRNGIGLASNDETSSGKGLTGKMGRRNKVLSLLKRK